MQITGTSTAATAATTTSRQGGTTTAKPSQQFDYMKLIVAQMRNLNPMDPSSGGDSLPIMMQAESLSQLTKLNQALGDLQTMTQTSYAASLMGRSVSGVDETGTTVEGTVKAIRMDGGAPALELASGRRLRLADVAAVSTT